MEEIPTAVRTEIHPDPNAPGEARASLAPLASSVPRDTLQTATLIVSELVTNGVRHAKLSTGERIEVRANASGEALRIEVCHAGRGFERPDSPQPHPDGGRWGLLLVDRASHAWNVERRGDRFCVWAELRW